MDWEYIVDILRHPAVIAALITGFFGVIWKIVIPLFKWIFPKIVKYWYKNAVPHPVNSFDPITKYSLPRNDMLEKIFKSLSKSSPVVLTGLGGIGKTQLALMYEKGNAAYYECRRWVNASSEQSILEAYREFAVGNLGMQDELKPEKYLEPVKQWMREHEKWLFVFDNADDPKDKQKWIPAGLTGMRHVLFTSRDKNWSDVAKVLPVELFGLEEAQEYFIKSTGRNDDGSLDDLIDALGYLPLAMAQAAAFIREGYPEEGYKEYLKLFEERTAEMLQKYPTAETDNRSVYVTWDISMERIKKATESAWQLLNIMAFFAPDGIRPEWFVQGQEALPEPLQKEIGDTLMWREIRKVLTGHSLVEESEGRALGMHRLVGEVVRDKLRVEKTYTEYAGYAVGVGEELCFFDFSTRERRNTFEELYPHIESVVGNCALQSQNIEVEMLYDFLGHGAREVWGDYDRALEWHEKALVVCEKVLGKEHPYTAETYNNIASIYRKNGEYNRALEWHKKSLTIREKIFGKEHPSRAISYHNIAFVYENKGDYDRALEWYKKALVIREKALGKEHPDTAATYNNIAIAYSHKNDYDRALEWYEKALDIQENILGKGHLGTAYTYDNIGNVYDIKGDYDRSLEWYEKALAIKEKVLGKEHPDTATTYDNIALVYDNKGDYNRALEWHEKALAIQEKVLGKEHPDTARTYNNIGAVYLHKGDYDRALDWFVKALAVWKEKLGEEHQNTILVRNNIAKCKRNMQC